MLSASNQSLNASKSMCTNTHRHTHRFCKRGSRMFSAVTEVVCFAPGDFSHSVSVTQDSLTSTHSPQEPFTCPAVRPLRSSVRGDDLIHEPHTLCEAQSPSYEEVGHPGWIHWCFVSQSHCRMRKGENTHIAWVF